MNFSLVVAGCLNFRGAQVRAHKVCRMGGRKSVACMSAVLMEEIFELQNAKLVGIPSEKDVDPFKQICFGL